MENGYSICLNIWTLDKEIKNELRLLLIISSLCAEKGYCWATNKYLGEIFDETEQSISNKISKLQDKGYIQVEYEKRGCEIIKRIIRLKNIYTDDIKNFIPSIKKNFKENNINIKNINTNKDVDIYSYVEDALGRTLNGIEFEEISKWDDTELTRYAIKKAILSGGRSIKYIQTILNSYKAKGILSVEDAIKLDGKKKDDTPNWFNQEQEYIKANDDEIDELKEMLKEFN